MPVDVVNLKKLKKLKFHGMGSLIGLLLIVVVLMVLTDEFLTVNNLFNLFRQISINALIAFGMTFVILTAGIDLSVGSIFALSGALAAGSMVFGLNTWLSVGIGLGAGLLMGAFNGVLVAKGGLDSFIVTLATMTIFRGLTLVFTNGRPITGLNEDFAFLGKGYFLQIPMPIIWMALAFAVLHILLKHTTFGRRVYAIGSNEEATWLSGISTVKVKVWVYSISGLLAAVSGTILTSRLDSAQPTAGITYELDAIAAVVLGGTSLSGGKGWIIGTLIGAVIIGILNNGLNLLNVSSFYQQVVKGSVILVAILFDRSEKRRK